MEKAFSLFKPADTFHDTQLIPSAPAVHAEHAKVKPAAKQQKAERVAQKGLEDPNYTHKDPNYTHKVRQFQSA